MLPLRAFSIQMAVFLAAVFVAVGSADGALIDFVNGTWNFGSGNVTGWQQPALTNQDYTGSSVLSNGVTVTIRIRDFGTTNHTQSSAASDHGTASTVGNGSGLNINQSSGSAYNSNNSSLTNYLRVDVTFSTSVYTSMFFHDIDNSNDNWSDALYAERFGQSFGAVGSGTDGNYVLGSTLGIANDLHQQDLDSIVADAGTGDVPLSIVDFPNELTSNSAQVGFNTTVRRFSFYYWNRDNDASTSDNQRIILTAFNAFRPTEVPEPGTVALLLTAASSGLVWRRRRSGSKSTPE